MNKVKYIAICTLVSLVLSGCGTSTGNDNSTVNNTEIIDINGDTVIIPGQIENVVCRSGNGTSFMVAMGLSDKLVGTADYVLTNPWCERFSEGFSSLQGFGWAPSVEEMYAIEADLVMVADPDVAEDLRTDGISAICYKQYNEQEILESVQLLGDIFGEEAADYAERWTQYYNDTDQYIENSLSAVKEDDKPVVYYIYGQSNKGVGRTAGGGSIEQFWIEEAGGVFSTEDLSNDGPTITEEDAITRNPDIIFIGGVYSKELKEELLNSPEWSNVKAVSDGNIHQIPIGFTGWDFYGAEFPLLKLWAAETMYPELIDKDLHEETKNFYSAYYNIDFSDAEIDYILNALAPNGNAYEN